MEQALIAEGPLEASVGRLRWKKRPRETGLRAVGEGPRGSVLHDGNREYAWVSPLGGGWQRPLIGWYFVCPQDSVGEFANTCNDPAPNEATAKVQAMAFVKARMKAPNAEIRGGEAVPLD